MVVERDVDGECLPEFGAHAVREEYEEYDTDKGTYAVISDPENRRAWIISTVTLDVRQ